MKNIVTLVTHLVKTRKGKTMYVYIDKNVLYRNVCEAINKTLVDTGCYFDDAEKKGDE